MEIGFPVIRSTVSPSKYRDPNIPGIGVIRRDGSPRVPTHGECPICHGPLFTKKAVGRAVGVVRSHPDGSADMLVDQCPEDMEPAVCLECRVCWWRPQTQ